MYHKQDGLTDTECADEPCRPELVYLYYYEDPPHGSAIGGIVYHERDGLTGTGYRARGRTVSSSVGISILYYKNSPPMGVP